MLEASTGALRGSGALGLDNPRPRASSTTIYSPTTRTDDHYLELLSIVGEALPHAASALEKCTEIISELSQLTVEYDSPLATAPTPNAKLALLGQYASRIGQPTKKLIKSANSFTSGLEDADTSVEAVMHWSPSELSQRNTEERFQLAERVSALRSQSLDAEKQLNTLRQGMADISARSRALGRPLSRINDALMTIIDGKAIVVRWTLPED
jgi:hypothetical protein